MPHIIYYSRLFCQVGKDEKMNARKLTLKDAMMLVVDFRINRRKKYPLYEILMIAACTIICGGKGFHDFERFGKSKYKWFKQFLPLENGIPSHDTFRRVFSLLDPAGFNGAMIKWLESIVDVAGDVVSIDGKCLRRARTKSGKQPCIVSALSEKSKMIIGQIKAEEKSSEITAIPNLLELLYLKGCIVSIDAAGCQKKIVRTIRKHEADYMISLKGNQTTMHDEIRLFFEDGIRCGSQNFRKASSIDCGHGRVERRTCWQSTYIDWFQERHLWKDLNSVCMVESEVYSKATGKTTTERRYFISSLGMNPQRALKTIRAHWGIESMHWTLDVSFDEDRSRARTKNAAENLAMLRHVVLNILRLDKSIVAGISTKCKELTWDDDKRYKLIIATTQS